MKKIAVITLHAVKNYGSVLQTYATQQVLKELGYKVEIINYIREFNLDKNIADKVTEKDHGLKKRVKQCVLIPTVYKWKKVFNSFLCENINLSKKVYTYDDDFKKKPINADIFCVGSDQVWNTEWNGGITRPLYLDFVHNVPKISFASSVGVDAFDNGDIKVIKSLLGEFNAISVRERSSINTLQAIGLNDIKYCLDPTLLICEDEWMKFAGKSSLKPGYILLCQLNHNSEFDQYAVNVANRLGKKLVRMCMRYDQIRLPGNPIVIPKVKEYLQLIKNADLVLTDSFHAVAFSINLNRNFIAVYPEKFNSRIEDILQNCDLIDRHVLSFDSFEIIEKQIDYSVVNNKLDWLRRESLDNLKAMLNECLQ